MSPSDHPSARWWIFTVILIADVLDLLDTTITNIAAPSIVSDLHASSSLTPWLGMSYALTMGSLLVIGGRLGDRFGHRNLFLTGLYGFAAASLLCTLAWAPYTLVGARIAQGAFGALLIPQGFTILLRTFPRSELGRVFGLFGPLLALSSISGPVVSGLLIEFAPFGLGWRAVFLVNVVLGAALIVVSSRVLPKGPADRTVHIDVGSSVILMSGLLAMLGGIIDGGESGWRSVDLALIVTGLVLFAVFVARERQAERPLLPPTLFRLRSFVAGLVVGSFFFAAVSGLLYVTSLYLQEARDLTPLRAGGMLAPVSIGIIATSFSIRSRIAALGRRLVAAGVGLTAIGVTLYVFVIVATDAPLIVLTIPLLLCGLGMGCCFGSMFATALGDVDEADAGGASGTLNAVQQIANAIGSALLSSAFIAVAQEHGLEHALEVCLGLVVVALMGCAASLPLLPRRAMADHH